MSLIALRWAMSIKAGSPGTKAVLVTLAHHAKDSGECFPSQKLLAEETELTIRTVRTALQVLEAKGLLRRERFTRPDGSRGADRCVLAIGGSPIETDHKGKSFPLAPADEGQGEVIAGSPPEQEEMSAGQGEMISPPPEIISPLTSFEPPQNLQEPSPGGGSGTGATERASRAVVVPLDPRQRLIDEIVATLIRTAGQSDAAAQRTFAGWLRLAGDDLVFLHAVVVEGAALSPRELVFTVEERLRRRRERARSPPRESTNGRIAFLEERQALRRASS